MSHTKGNKPRWPLQGMPQAIKPLGLKYLLHYDKICNLEMGVQKLDWLKVNILKAREDIFHDGKAVIQRVLDETSQRKNHDAQF